MKQSVFFKQSITFCLLLTYLTGSLMTIFGKELPDSSPKELDEYIALPDDSFQWKIIEKKDEINEKVILIEMVSQTWQGIPWKHYLLIALPNKQKYFDFASLYIGGKRIGNMPGDGDLFLARSLAEATAMPVGMLFQVPNQPLFGNYVEDALIGETLLKSLETGDMTWPLLFPMAKSVLRALDAVQEVLKQEKKLSIESFVIMGASKRGWTTWLAAASKDKRVKAIAPIVIDTLNIRRQMEYQIETWDDYSPSIHDYTSRNLVRKEGKALSEFEERLWTMIDPYSYRTRYTIPKMLVHGTNDPYWTVDASQFYWDDLPGIKYMLTLPNAGHGLDGQQVKAVQSIAVFARHAAERKPWPRMTWKLEEQEKQYNLKIDADLSEKRVKLWTAHSEIKDFRKAKWTSKSIEAGIEETIPISKPEAGHVAFFVELSATEYGIPFSLTTQVWRF